MTDSIAYRGLRYRKSIVTIPSNTPDPGPTPSFDPADLALTGWWKGEDYDDSGTGLWTGSASAGTSGAHTFCDNTSAGAYKPAVGASINGIATVDMVDNFRWLETNVNTSELIDATEGTIFVVANITSIGTSDMDPNWNDKILSIYGGLGGIAGNSLGPYAQMVSYDGNYDHDDVIITLSQTILLTYRLNGGNIYSRLNKNPFSAGVATGGIFNTANPLVTSGPSNVVGRYGEIITAKGLSLSDCDDISDYLIDRFAIV